MPPIRQAAAVPFRDGLVCMVTSSNRRRWVFPKGKIEPGQTPGEAALAETWEEAGLTGTLDGDAVGSYEYAKYDRDYVVAVFVMSVTGQADDWPERADRSREWVTVEEALERVAEPGLRRILREVNRHGRPVEESESGR